MDRTEAVEARDTSSREGIDGRTGFDGGGRYEAGKGEAKTFW